MLRARRGVANHVGPAERELGALLLNERAIWEEYAQRVGPIPPGRGGLFPEFLFASPGKTGTTWLADVLRRHPDVYLPPEKELHYFDLVWRDHDIHWYLDQFEAVTEPCRGDGTPNFRLPRHVFETIRMLRPDVRWIVWMREPVAHAWSFLRHACRWREDPFAAAQCSISELGERALCAAALSDAVLTAIDPLGIVDRLSAVFPPSQIHVGFLEDAAVDPAAAIDAVFAFLGLRRDVDHATLGLEDRAFVGEAATIPPDFEHWLRGFLSARARAFDAWLRRERGRAVPPTWNETLAAGDTARPRLVEDLSKGRGIWAFEGALHAVDGSASAARVAEVIRAGRAVASANTRFELDGALAADRPGPLARWIGRRRAENRRRRREDERLESVLSSAARPLRVVTQVDLMDVVGRYNLVRRTTRPAPEARRWLQGEREEWLAVHQETGPIDLRFERVGDRSLGPMVAVASGEASLRARVAELVAREEQITAERHESAASAPEPDAAE